MSIKITDVSNVKKPEEKLKPIELVKCLQVYPRPVSGKEESYYFSSSNNLYPIPPNTKEIIRLAKIDLQEQFDLIAIYRERDPSPIIYLGHWNDGVIENTP